uniref:Uncharacterized protein n=1 Tax=Rhizophora mucronata TaxID=61149 RepID=A0A2P2N8Z7_RHIMU
MNFGVNWWRRWIIHCHLRRSNIFVPFGNGQSFLLNTLRCVVFHHSCSHDCFL